MATIPAILTTAGIRPGGKLYWNENANQSTNDGGGRVGAGGWTSSWWRAGSLDGTQVADALSN